MCALLGATLFVPATTAAGVTIKLGVALKGEEIDHLNLVTSFPRTVSLAVNNSAPGATFFWQFGDGSNSTSPAPTHTFVTSCVYDVQVQERISNGSVARGELVFGAFDTTGQSGRTLAVCPPQGTEGLIPVELAGSYFTARQSINVTMNGTSIAVVTADSGGDWILNVTGFLTPEPNGTQYAFATTPPSLTSVFTTLEGIRARPVSGAPGDSVTVEGRSYLSNSPTLVYLGNVNLGTAYTDGNGSFVTTFGIPSTYPLILPGTYQYTTTPPILGSHASFASAGALTTVFTWWWVWLLLIALVLVVAYLVRRRMKHRAVLPTLEPEPFDGPTASFGGAVGRRHRGCEAWQFLNIDRPGKVDSG
jgi:hypothetical protein